MSRFNEKSPGTKTRNVAGGDAYSNSPELELLLVFSRSNSNKSSTAPK